MTTKTNKCYKVREYEEVSRYKRFKLWLRHYVGRYLRYSWIFTVLAFLGVFWLATATDPLLNLVEMLGFAEPLVSGADENRRSWILSFHASLVQDIMFFSLFGIVLFLFSKDRAQNQNILPRLWYLYSGNRATTSALTYNLEKIRFLAAFSPNLNISIEIEEYNEEYNAFKVHVTFDMLIANMSRKEVFDDSLAVRVYPDDIPILFERGELWGAIKEVTLAQDSLTKRKDLLSKTINMYGNSVWYDNFPLRIKKNGIVQYDYRFWQWAKVGEDFIIGTLRYTDRVNLSIHSSCAGKQKPHVEVSFTEKFRSDWQKPIDKKVLTDGEKLERFNLRSVTPEKKITLKFLTQ